MVCTLVITDDTAPNGDGASVIAKVHLQTANSYRSHLLRVKLSAGAALHQSVAAKAALWRHDASAIQQYKKRISSVLFVLKMRMRYRSKLRNRMHNFRTKINLEVSLIIYGNMQLRHEASCVTLVKRGPDPQDLHRKLNIVISS